VAQEPQERRNADKPPSADPERLYLTLPQDFVELGLSKPCRFARFRNGTAWTLFEWHD
jgi:hypothetical protein